MLHGRALRSSVPASLVLLPSRQGFRNRARVESGPWADSRQAATSFRSVTSAAKRSTSAMLSRGKSEYSRTMSSYDMPSAKHARMNDAEKRVPRIVGLPPRRSRFVTRYGYPGIGVSSMMSSGLPGVTLSRSLRSFEVSRLPEAELSKAPPEGSAMPLSAAQGPAMLP